MTTPVEDTRRTRRPSRLLALVVLAAALAACGDDSSAGDSAVGAGSSAPAAPTVEIERSRFSPVDLTVEVGDVVEFTNLDAFDHTVTSAAGSSVAFDSDPFGEGETFTQQFDEPGTYRYFCEIHPTMRGSIVVE